MKPTQGQVSVSERSNSPDCTMPITLCRHNMKALQSDLDITHQNALKAAHFHSTLVTLGASISTFILVAKEHSDPVYLLPFSFEHQSLVPCIIPTLPFSAKQSTFVANVYQRQGYLG